jgi:hypothetical protein
VAAQATDVSAALHVEESLPNSPARTGAIMSIDRLVLAFAGIMIILSLVLSYFVSPYWLILAGFVGLNLLQSAFTGFCPLALILKKLGFAPGVAFT